MAGSTTPGSWQALREAASDLRKVICYQLGRQAGIVDKWMLAPPADAATRDANGIPNPLDHVIAIHNIVTSDSPARAVKMIDWLCRQCGGRFCKPPAGQRQMLFDAGAAAEIVAALAGELNRSAVRPAKIAELRRRLQDVVDALGTRE